MAKTYKYRWNGWRTDLRGGEIKDRPLDESKQRKRKQKGITNDQAKLLARLQREAGVAYSGSGMTCQQAREEISRLLKAKAKR